MTLPETVHFWIELVTRFISPQIVAAEWVLVVLVIFLIGLSPMRPWQWLDRFGGWFRRLAARKTLAIVICGCLPVVARLSMLGVFPVPVPSIHDEFSHLLLADTLAHGRLSNPTHPMWQHFESIHIIQQPTYSSMYPPAQGIFLALGQILFHLPWAGVLLSVGLMFAATCWMMQQWMSPSSAFYGTLIAIARIGIFGPWIDSYLGGPVSALGGALVIGAAPCLREAGSKTRHALLFALGLVILMNSRPFEGAFIGAAALLWILSGAFRQIQTGGWRRNIAVWAPAAGLLACGFIFTGFYSRSVTGSPLRMPYMVNRETYGWPENLAFLPVRTVSSRHKALNDMYTMEVARREHLRKWHTFLDDIDRRIFENWSFFIGPLLTLPLLFAIANFKNAQIYPLVVLLGIIAFLNLVQLVLYPYHLGPVVAVMFALAAQGLSLIYAKVSRWRMPAGPILALLLPMCLLGASTLKRNADQLDLPLTYWESSTESHRAARADIEHWLSQRSGGQLVLVRYLPAHSPNQEWVYNGADIDRSKIVWAREMNPESDAQLLHYFKDREVWLLRADVRPQHLVHYPAAAAAGENSSEAGKFPAACKCEKLK